MDVNGHPIGGERWERLHKTGYTLMIGRRLKRIREGRHLTQQYVADRTRKPRGTASTHIDPARVMGPEDAEKPVDEAEMALIKFLRRAGISIDEAIVRLAKR